MAFLAQITVSFFKILIIAFFFCEKRHFFAENWQKSQKIVIITSTPVDSALLSNSVLELAKPDLSQPICARCEKSIKCYEHFGYLPIFGEKNSRFKTMQL
jgi:hypothetical protein